MSERVVGVELFKQATSRLARGQVAVALRLAGRAREVFTAIGDIEAACGAASLEGRIHLRSGRLGDAAAAFDHARQEAARRGLEARELSALTELGSIHELQGDLALAIAVHREVLDRQRRRDDNVGIAVAAGNVGRLLQRLVPAPATASDPERPAAAGSAGVEVHADARSLLLEAMRRFEVAGNAAGIANAQICLGDLERARGNLDAAQAAFAQVVRATTGGRLEPLHALAQLNLGHLLRDRGDVSGALAAFARSQEIAQRIGDHPGAARAALAIAMARADTAPLFDTAAAFSEVEQRYRKLGQPAGELTASVNRAAILCRMGRLHDGRLLLDRARSRLLAQGDRLGALEVGLALAEVQLTMGDAAATEAELAAAPAHTCTGRLGLRRALLEVRLHVRALRIVEAHTLLAGFDPHALSEAERFAVQLARCEIATLRGDPEVQASLDALAGRAQATHSRRDAAAVVTARAYEAWLRGPLADAAVLARAAAACWRECDEPLPLLHARVLVWRVDALSELAVHDAQVCEVVQQLRKFGAVDAAMAVETLSATLLARHGDAAARRAVERGIEGLRSGGNELAAVSAEAFAATVLANPALHDRAARRFAASGCAVPRWFRASVGG